MSELDKQAAETAKSGKESVSSSAKQDKASKSSSKKKEKEKEKKLNRLLRWFKDLKGELKKVTWPSAKDTMKNVLVVIVCVLIVGGMIWIFDWLVRLVVEALLNLFG